MCESADDSSAWKLATAFSAVSVTTASLVAYLWAKKQKYLNGKIEETKTTTTETVTVTAPPEKWVRVGKIESLILYPIKSCKGIEMESAIVTKLGLQGRPGSKTFQDRVFVVLDRKGREATQGKYPKMSLIEVTISDDDKITLYAPDMEPITFSAPDDTPEARRSCELVVTLDKDLTVIDCGDEVAAWFDEYLGRPGFHVAYYIPGVTKEQRKLTEDQLMYSTFSTSDIGVFQNEASYLLIAEESITEMNKHSDVAATHRNFRPTILVEQIPEPFAELKWSYIKLGDREDSPILKNGRPCDRCNIITIDTETGEPDRKREIMKTLIKMEFDLGSELANNHMKSKAVMGNRMGLYSPRDDSVVRVGDPIYAALL